MSTKVLLVEDDRGWENFIKDWLQKAIYSDDSQFEDFIQVASSFEAASHELDRCPWDLLIVDLGLPPWPNQPLGRELVARANSLHVRTIAVTALPITKNDERFLEENGAFLFKKGSLNKNEFIAKVKEFSTHSASSNEADKSPQKLKGHALLIGIATYSNISKLAKTTTDAQDFYKILIQNGYPSQNITLLLDHQATKSSINSELVQLAETTREDDIVVVFFAGHGAQFIGGFWPGEYLCPVEAALNSISDSCISSQEFTSALNAIPAKRIVVFLDACHSGGLGKARNILESLGDDVQVNPGLTATVYEQISKSEGRVIIASCKPDEVSWEYPDMRNGLFTHYILEGMRGEAAEADGTIWVTRLYNYAYQHVSQKQKNQHPYLTSLTEDFVIAISQK